MMDSLATFWREFSIGHRLANLKSEHHRRARLYKTMASYARTGNLSLSAIISNLAESKRAYGDPDAVVFEEISTLIDEDNVDVISAIGRISPPDELLVIQASQRGSNGLVSGLRDAFEMATHKKVMKSKTYSLAGYPVVMLIFTLIISNVVVTTIVPQFLKLQEPGLWPVWTLPVYYLYILYEQYAFLLGLFFIAVICFIVWGLTLRAYGVREYLDYLPPFNIQKRIHCTSFLLSLSALLNSGMSFPRAIDYMLDNAGAYLRDHLYLVKDSLNGRENAGEAICTGLLNNELSYYMRDIVKSSPESFVSALRDIAKDSAEETLALLERSVLILAGLILLSAVGFDMYLGFALDAINNSFVESIKHR